MHQWLASCRRVGMVLFAIAMAISSGAVMGDPPNIVFILIDDFGYADCGAYGAKDIKTPNIDRLAAEGVKFSHFYSNAPVCSPTRCAFITGRWQQRIGFEWAMGFSADSFWRRNGELIREPDIHAMGLPPGTPTLPGLLKQAGYATGVFGKWHLGYRDQYNPLHHGFDEYFGELLGHCDYYQHAYYDGTYALRDGLDPVHVEGYLTDLINARAAAFIDKHAKEPFFLYVPHLAVHCPYQPPNRPLPSVTKENMYDGNREIYASMVEKVDEGVGMILERLEAQGLSDNTWVVLSSDNGGERYSDNRPLFHHKSTLWEGGIHVPCLMRWPSRLPKGITTDQVAITMDLSRSFATAAGAKVDTMAWDGIDLIPVLSGAESRVDRTLCWRIDRVGRQQKAIRNGDWKYIQDGNVEMLFDLANDIGERHDRSYDHPQRFVEMKAKLSAWEADIDRNPPTFLVK